MRSDPATGCLPKRAPRAASLRSTSLPHCGYAGGPLGPTCAVSASLVSAPQSVSLAHSDHQARLCNSVRPASPQVQGCPLHFSESCRYPCLACGDRSPTGEGRDRAGPSCRYEVRVLQPLLHCTQEKRWATTDLGSASFESEPSQATVQDAHAETHFRVRPSPRLVCSDRPEGCVLSCLDSSSTQAVSALCVLGSSISVQGPTLRAGPVSPRLHESRGKYRLAALHTLIAPESPYRQTLLSPPITLRQPDVAERPVPGLYSVVSLRTGFRLGPICVTLQGSHMCYSTGCS